MLAHIQRSDLSWKDTEKLVQELAWRDYWQQVWISKKDSIKKDLKNQQAPISNFQIPQAIVNANTGIKIVDRAIEELYKTGYMHNHMRMYVASICCNIANSHWYEPARWMYSHLLDGDVASNHLSWQWVAGANANKKYYANQDNINKFFRDTQRDTFLDVSYEAFENLEVPEILKATTDFTVGTTLPDQTNIALDRDQMTLVYNYYNIDPYWHQGEDVQRVFLLEPSFFSNYPVSQKCLDFAIQLTQNIDGIKLFVGEFSALQKQVASDLLIYKEHPTSDHYVGQKENREWMSNVTGHLPSFFGFWKKCKKELLR